MTYGVQKQFVQTEVYVLHRYNKGDDGQLQFIKNIFREKKEFITCLKIKIKMSRPKI